MAERQGALSTVSSGDWPATGDILQDYFSPREYGHYFWHGFPFAENAFRRIFGVLLRQKKKLITPLFIRYFRYIRPEWI